MSFTVTRTNYQPAGGYVTTVDTLGVGTTLTAKYETVQVMSDIWESQLYVTYWDFAANKVAGAFLTDESDVKSVAVDYTPEALSAYIKWKSILAYTQSLDRQMKSLTEQHSAPAKGKKIVIERGLLRNSTVKGTEYPVFHVMTKMYKAGYGAGNPELMVGIALDDVMEDRVHAPSGKTYSSHKNTAWVWARNVRVVGAADAIEAGRPMAEAQARVAMKAEAEHQIANFAAINRKVA